MNFIEAEQQFRDLEQKWKSGRMSNEAYRASLASISVMDPGGETWKMQEHTGKWFVFHAGQWVEGQPAPAPLQNVPVQPQPAPAQPPLAAAQSLPAQPAPQAAAARPNRSATLWIVLGLLGLGVVCTGLVAAGFLLSTGKLASLTGQTQPGQPEQATDNPGPSTQVEVKPAENTSIPADGTAHSDPHGVSLSVPTQSLPEGGQVNLAASEINAPWRKAIEAGLTIETPFYRLNTSGKDTSAGDLTLSFPAPNANSRLLAVIDNEYLVELAQQPEGGKLSLQARAGPSDGSDIKPVEGYDGDGSIYYAVITPNTSSETGHPHLARSQREVDERNCIPDISLIGGVNLNLCRQNAAGTIQVLFPNSRRELLPQVDLMVDKIEATMAQYAGLGFSTAVLSHSAPMIVRVSSKISSPSYYPLNGVLYIPDDSVAKIATQAPHDVYHEMAHWIQSVKYYTRVAYWSGEKTWWLEVSAENMVMLVDPSYVAGNLSIYGTITQADNTLALQASPYQWPDDFYAQAQLVKVNLCDSPACPLSPASFAKAISEGSYPLMDAGRKGQISANLMDYAFYLLGKPPSASNSAIPMSGPVKTGNGYGEYIRITRTTDTDLKYDMMGSDPQMRKETKDGKEVVVVEAKIQKDGVYPLMILGGEGKNPGLPVEMDIQPGASFYYTLDDGELKYSDGSQELKLLPISGTMGIKKVRIAAIGSSGGEIFKAEVKPLDLAGAWVVAAEVQKIGGSMSCSGGSGTVDNPNGTAQLMAYFTTLASGTGDMQTDSSGRNLDWNAAPARIPAEFSKANVTYKATALLAGDTIQYQAVLDIPRENEGSGSIPLLPGAAVSACVFPIAWINRKRLKSRHLLTGVNLAVLCSLALVLSGCFGMGMYGTANIDAKFTKIEYVGGQDTGVVSFSNETGVGAPQGKPLWKLTGSGSYDVTFNIETSTSDGEGKSVTEVNTCTGKVTFPVTAYVYQDVRIEVPKQ